MSAMLDPLPFDQPDPESAAALSAHVRKTYGAPKLAQAPEFINVRGTFDRFPTLAREAFQRGPYKGWRLMDCLMVVVKADDVRMLDEPANGCFAVVDTATKEKAFFEMPHGAQPAVLAEMIQSHFAANPTRIGFKTWIV
jgi:hypothetical protein